MMPDAKVAYAIGTLDWALSQLKLIALAPETTDADLQTVKHHAEDCVGLGNRVLEILGERRARAASSIAETFGFSAQTLPVAWYDHFNNVAYTDKRSANKAADGGNRVTPLYIQPDTAPLTRPQDRMQETLQVSPRIGDVVLVFDRYRFAVPLRARVVELSPINSGVEVSMLESNNVNWPVGCRTWVDVAQLRPE